jgi:hypothetical protein
LLGVGNISDFQKRIEDAVVKLHESTKIPKVLTPEEHVKYVHLCGLTGKQTDVEPSPCEKCERLYECIESHAIIGEDAESRVGFLMHKFKGEDLTK